ncbi:polyketide cyclase [Paenibacillus agaridevorans]|uniref:Polyketide cyclase n=1 Tax=Paenibacillus agaridevorans TaxID=171404 RepID=A0A2R5EVG8_9BACL|nr:SRPBCC domain-containing protein [Paenibacillus agaridevorans]GBG07391.1 polyketide cyclase [Paenibacillus agaridevorans]
MRKLIGKAGKGKDHGITVKRSFQVPLALLFEVITKPEHMQHWKGPRGFVMTIVSEDVRPGGKVHYSQSSPEGQIMWSLLEYVEIAPNEKFVYTNAFSDEEGNTLRAPFSQMWPLRILNTLTFREDGDMTELTMHGKAFETTKAEIQFFESFKENVKVGFADTFELLDEYLAKLQK